VIEVTAIDTPSLGNRSYLATDGVVALVVDPQQDIDRVLVAAADRGVAVAHVFETHIHHDYLSGGPALAAETGASYHVNGADEVALTRSAIGDGDVIEAGAMRVRALGRVSPPPCCTPPGTR
jgi:glyoxylase-like metal-dependent hydrolase (beta-lactamase superfamily II)